jgi:hypothetical protein
MGNTAPKDKFRHSFYTTPWNASFIGINKNNI